MASADQPHSSSSKLFVCDYDKRGQASCKRCKQKITKGSFRLAKLVPNHFSDNGGDMKQWHHPKCLFDAFSNARATTAKIYQLTDVDGYEALNAADRQTLDDLIVGLKAKVTTGSNSSPKKNSSPSKIEQFFPSTPSPSKPASAIGSPSKAGDDCEDVLFSSFCNLCNRIAAESSYKMKTSIVENFIFRQGATGKHGYCGDTFILLRLLLPNEKGLDRVYNMSNKQLVKIFADIFGADGDKILNETNEHGDISVVIADNYFAKDETVKPVKRCSLTLTDVDNFLDSLTRLTKYDDQYAAFRKFIRSCGVSELRYVIRLLKHDLRMNAKARGILDAISPTAYDAFQHSRDLKAICSHISATKSPDGSPKLKKDLSVKATLMTPIQPMLAEACKSVEYALSKCPKGMFAEIKYDGERVQVHHSGTNFSYYSRNLKPVLPHKVSYLSEAIPKAFPTATDLILDGEIVLVDTVTHNPLPFGTLGVHKASKFQKAQVCMYIFDCMHMNGKSLMNKPLIERREALRSIMHEIPDRVVLSEVHKIEKSQDLQQLLDHVFTEGLEGLVLKPSNTLYEPGKRHWLKMKKDYLAGGAMADTADLIVLGAYFGSGAKGGLMSIFLMGVYDAAQKKYLTVTKCANGHDDSTLARLQKELDMVRIDKNPAKVPSWLVVKNAVVPDFVIRDPKNAPVWEITGAEFSKAEIHTADGISIRFPRVTKIRDDKDWQSATSLEELKILQKNSRQQAPTLHNTKVANKKQSPVASPPPKKKQVKRKILDSESEEESADTASTESYDDIEARPSTSARKEPTPSPVKAPSPVKKQKSVTSVAGEKQLDWQPADIFTSCHFYFDKSSLNDDKSYQALIRSAIAYGASAICKSPSDKITYWIVSDTCKNIPASVPKTAQCLKMGWLAACIKAKSLVDPKSYIVN